MQPTTLPLLALVYTICCTSCCTGSCIGCGTGWLALAGWHWLVGTGWLALAGWHWLTVLAAGLGSWHRLLALTVGTGCWHRLLVLAAGHSVLPGLLASTACSDCCLHLLPTLALARAVCRLLAMAVGGCCGHWLFSPLACTDSFVPTALAPTVGIDCVGTDGWHRLLAPTVGIDWFGTDCWH